MSQVTDTSQESNTVVKEEHDGTPGGDDDVMYGLLKLKGGDPGHNEDSDDDEDMSVNNRKETPGGSDEPGTAWYQ